jgi:hypothetical protein
MHHGRAVVASFGRQNLFVSSIERQQKKKKKKKTSRTMMMMMMSVVLNPREEEIYISDDTNDANKTMIYGKRAPASDKS